MEVIFIMVLVCGKSALDLDKFNDYKPDGEHVYCKFDAATHKPESVPKKDIGSFVKTEDNSVVYFEDIVFKMLMDLSVKAQLDNAKYIVNEAKRANVVDENGNYILERPKTKGPLGTMLAQYHVKNVLMPSDAKIVPHNLKIFAEYDIVTAMCPKIRIYEKAYAEACNNMICFLAEYVYLGKATKSMTYMHKALVELMRSFDLDDFKNFVEDFYAYLNKIPAKNYVRPVVDEVNISEAIENKKPDDDIDDTMDEMEKTDDTQDSEADNASDENNVDSSTVFGPKLVKISSADITGLDETYTAGYCEAFYNQELENANSEGFLEQLIAARANGGAAPIDLLSEAITREHKQDNPADVLRSSLHDIRSDIQNALANQQASGNITE